jgi:hypothetical protein
MFSLFCHEIYFVTNNVFSILSANLYVKKLNVYCLLLGIFYD